MSAGGLSRRLRDGGAGSSSASGRRPSSDSGNSSSGAAAVQHSSGLPASEATLERRGQVGSQRQTISRVICGPTAAKPAAGAWQSWGDVDLDVPQDPPARCGTQHLCTVPGFADISLSVRCQGCAAKVVPLRLCRCQFPLGDVLGHLQDCLGTNRGHHLTARLPAGPHAKRLHWRSSGCSLVVNAVLK